MFKASQFEHFVLSKVNFNFLLKRVEHTKHMIIKGQ